MPHTDLPLDELARYRPPLAAPDDLDTFWSDTLDNARSQMMPPVLTRAESPYELVDTYDVEFSGFAGDRVRAWLSVPAGTVDPLPAVVDFIGYGGGRGAAHQFVTYALAGYAHFVMDNRGMGGWGAVGSTPDLHPESGLNQTSGFMTRGITSPADHYLRRLITDGVLAVDAARSISLVDGSRVAVAGASLGGGLSLAAASLADDVRTAIIDVPFLCHYPRAIRITDSAPYSEIAGWMKTNNTQVAIAERTLSYFDAAILGSRANASAMFSVGLMDDVCPPSTVFAAYNSYGGATKEIKVYPFNGHEGGLQAHELERFTWLRAHG